MKKKNKILILTGIFSTDLMGGPATQLDPLIREIIKKGYQVEVLAFGKKESIKYPYSVKKVSHQWPYFLKLLVYLIKGLWLGFRADILYNQDLYTSGLASLIIKKIFRKPLITRFVGESAWETAIARGWTNDDIITFQEKRYSWRIELRKKIRNMILNNSDRIVVVSYFLKELAQKIGLPPEKIKVIYNSIDFLKEKPSLSDKEELKQKMGLQGRILLTNARLTRWKGVDMLIELMPPLIKKYNQIKLVVIGQGSELENLKKLTKRLDLENYVFFVGKVGRQKVVDYLAVADLFLLNTNYEGMSHVLLEAMKIGVPIITTKAGGNPETIKDGQTGLLVDYRNKEQWIEAINHILDNPDLAEKLVGQAKEDLKRFSWPKLVQETIQVFRDL
jgi:glycosyltransferase involved in cell wall biosynthesis